MVVIIVVYCEQVTSKSISFVFILNRNKQPILKLRYTLDSATENTSYLVIILYRRRMSVQASSGTGHKGVFHMLLEHDTGVPPSNPTQSRPLERDPRRRSWFYPCGCNVGS